MYTKGKIHDVVVRDLAVYTDGRGSLVEMWRMDDIAWQGGASPDSSREKVEFKNQAYSGPVMAYQSWTLPGKVRGFHQHERQKDHFFFSGPGVFKIVLFDDRDGSPSKGNLMELFGGSNCPKYVMVPEMVYHGYKSVGHEHGLVINFPDSLFAGWGKKSPVDEMRFDPHTNYWGYSWDDKDN